MKKLFLSLFLAVAAMTYCQAEDFKDWHGINEASVEQHIDVQSSTICVVAHSKVQMKGKKAEAKQQAAIDALGETIVSELKDAFPKANVQLIVDAKDAPADAIVIDAVFEELVWGTAHSLAGSIAGNGIQGRYSAKATNAKGIVFTMKNHRLYNNPFASTKGQKVIESYNESLAEDIVVVVKEVNK